MADIKLNLYNKYRPATLDEVLGQEHVTSVIGEYLTENSLPHSIIFYGPPGTGKTSLARIIAKALNPSKQATLELDSSEEGSKDQIHHIIQGAYNAPLSGSYKIYIFDEAQEITRQAFSALLKITEEPPEHVKFIFLTTDFDKIPMNIKSRSQCHSLFRIPREIIKSRLEFIAKSEGISLPEKLLNSVVTSSSGSLRNAIVALEEAYVAALKGESQDQIETLLGVSSERDLNSFVFSYINKDVEKLYESSKFFCRSRKEPARALNDLQQFIMDARLWLVHPSLSESSYSNLTTFETAIGKKLSKLDKEESLEYRRSIGRHLDSLYERTLDLELDFKKTANKEARVQKFVVDLFKSFSI